MADATNAGDVAEVQTQIDFPVYMIYSRWSLNTLDEFLINYGGAGFLRIVFGKEDKETDRTIAILTKNTYDSLCDAGYGENKREDRSYGQGFRVTPFLLNENSYPGEGRNKTLFVPVPKVLGGDDSWVTDAVTEKLQHLAEWDIVPASSWSVKVPLKSREQGGVRGGCFISFKRDVPLERIAMTRVLLTDTYWPDSEAVTERSIFRCFWARDRESRDDREEKGDRQHDDGAAETRKSPEDAKKAKEKAQEEKKRRAIQKFAKKARPVQAKKAPILPVATQPVLLEDKELMADMI